MRTPRTDLRQAQVRLLIRQLLGNPLFVSILGFNAQNEMPSDGALETLEPRLTELLVFSPTVPTKLSRPVLAKLLGEALAARAEKIDVKMHGPVCSARFSRRTPGWVRKIFPKWLYYPCGRTELVGLDIGKDVELTTTTNIEE